MRHAGQIISVLGGDQLARSLPGASEICVERVKPLRFAEAKGGYDAFFKNFNDTITAAMAGH